MAKSSRKNKGKNLSNPIAKPVKPPTDPELIAIREKQILPIISDLTSSETAKRSTAAVAVANLIEDTKCRKLLLREQVVRILLEQTITDSSLDSKSAGWGILKNLIFEEEADFCVHLYRQDILTPLQSVMQLIVQTLESSEHSFATRPEAERELFWTLITSVIGLLSSLAEASEEILDAISHISGILSFPFGLLNVTSIPEELYEEILQCLASLTEDNRVLTQQIADTEPWFQGLMRLREQGGSTAVAACGVLHNILSSLEWYDHNTPVGVSDAVLIPTLVESMDKAREQSGSSNGSGHSHPDRVLQLALEITASIATSLQEALEHAQRNEKEFEGFGDHDDENGEDEDEQMGEDGHNSESAKEDDGDSEDEITEEMDADMEQVTGFDAPNYAEEGEAVNPTLEAVIRDATPAVLRVVDSAAHEKGLRDATLSVLNNIVWTVSSVDFTANSSRLINLWSSTAQQIWDKVVSPVLASNTADIDLASIVTSIAWALARGMQGQLKLQPEEQRKFMALYQASKNLSNGSENDSKKAKGETEDDFQGLGVKCIGVLGRLALDPAPIDLNREIGVFLLTILAGLPETPPADAIEALNQLFDIYADKDFACDAVFLQDGFLQHLEELKPRVSKMTKSIDKRKKTELRGRADEAVLNLGRFLKYKTTERTA